jgi:RNA polymerase sigma factor (sigma-70 family)
MVTFNTHSKTNSARARDDLSFSRHLRDDWRWRGGGETADVEGVGPDIDAKAKPFEETDDSLVGRYLEDIRHFSLLSRSEEAVLWRRIECARRRVQRVLIATPVALPTLQRIGPQVQCGEMPLHRIFCKVAATDQQQAEQRAYLRTSVARLQQLSAQFSQVPMQPLNPPCSVLKRRALRQQVVTLGRQWITTWEALSLHGNVYDTIQLALETELQGHPDDRALQLATHRLTQAQRRLAQCHEAMLRANLRLVIYVAKRYRGQGVPFSDLIQEGNLGLMHALEKFDVHRGWRFITYAYWWVRQAISRAIVEQPRTVRLPNHVVERQHKLRTVEKQLESAYDRPPTVQELSVASGWTPEEVEALRGASGSILPLQHPLTEHEDRELLEVLTDSQVSKPEDVVAMTQCQQRVSACLARLTEREALVLRLRFGIGTDHEYTLQEIGTRLGVSRERVRQVEGIALAKLRQSPATASLADFSIN